MIEYHAENIGAPWVCLVGKHKSIWFAYPSFIKALIKYPKLIWRFRHHG